MDTEGRGARVHTVRQYFGLSMQAFGDRLGLAKSTISSIESRNSLTDQVGKLISVEFGVSYAWLMDGQGEMLLPSTKQNDLAKLYKAVFEEPHGGIKSKIISLLANLPEEHWKVIADIAERIACEPDEEGG